MVLSCIGTVILASCIGKRRQVVGIVTNKIFLVSRTHMVFKGLKTSSCVSLLGDGIFCLVPRGDWISCRASSPSQNFQSSKLSALVVLRCLLFCLLVEHVSCVEVSIVIICLEFTNVRLILNL